MEAFGVAANVMAAVSLTLQLADNIEKIKQFWRDMRAAPKDVENILRELELLKGIIEGLRRALTMKHHHGPDPAQVASVLAALLECQRHVASMTDFASDLQGAMGKRRLMTAFKTVLKNAKIAEFGRHIEQAKTTLLLAISVATFLLQEACSERVRLQFCDLRSDIEMKFSMEPIPPPRILDSEPIPKGNFIPRKIASTHRQISISDILLWLLQLPLDSPHREYLRNTRNLIGRISWRLSSWKSKAVNRSMAISIHLPIVQRAFTLESQKSLGQWTHTFRISRIVPDSSPIFRACAAEDYSSVLRLFESGQASPFDQTSSGITLLHAAAAGYCSRIYKFLHDFGVEYTSYDHPQYGKLAPVELTQDFTIFVDGRQQTVQQWLSIDSSDDSRVFHPEYNYQNVVHIWNAIMETEEQISDELIITLLQGPLRVPRQSSFNVTPATYKCSIPLFLLCFYFLFKQDPYGRNITSATLHSRYLREPVSFYEYTRKYWDGEHWKRMLTQCKGLDFGELGRRQQRNFTGFTWIRSTDTTCGKLVRKRVATFNFCADEEWIVRIGPLEDFQAIFEF